MIALITKWAISCERWVHAWKNSEDDHSICHSKLDRVKRIWYLSPMRAAKVQASLRIRAVSPEPPLLAHTSTESRGTFRQKTRSLAPLNGWACAVEICHDGMLEDTNSLDGAQLMTVCHAHIVLASYNTKCMHIHLHLQCKSLDESLDLRHSS